MHLRLPRLRGLFAVLLILLVHSLGAQPAPRALAPEDFDLYEDGVKQKIEYVDEAGPATGGPTPSPVPTPNPNPNPGR